MWGRVIEIMAAVWLVLSPYVFRATTQAGTIAFDSSVALTIAILAGLSYWKPASKSHLLILLVAVGLGLHGRFATMSPSPWHQNHIFLGLFLLMVALVPSDASRPPVGWRNKLQS